MDQGDDTVLGLTEPTEPPSGLLRNIGWAAASQVISLVAGAGALVIAGRALGVDGQGVYALALVVPYLGQLLFNAGLGIANLHFVASGRATAAAIAENSMVLSIWSTGLAGVVCLALVVSGAADTVLPDVSTRMVAIAFASLPFLLVRGALSGVLRGLHEIRAAVVIDTLERVVNLVVLVALAVSGHLTVELAVLGTVISSGVSAIAIGAAVRRRVPDAHLLRPRTDRPLIWATLRMAFPVYLGNAIQYLNYRLDVVFVGALAGVTGVGLYSVSYRIAEMLLLVPNAIGFVHVSRAAADVDNQHHTGSIRLFWVAMTTVLAACAVVAVVAGPGIRIVFGDEYAGAVRPLLLLLPGIVALAGGGVLANDIAGRGRASFNAWGSAAALVVTVACSILVTLIGKAQPQAPPPT